MAVYGPLYVGMGPLTTISATLASTATFNPAAVTAAVIAWLAPDGVTTGTWTATIASQSSTSITVQYALTGTELTQVGTYSVYAICTIPGGTVRSEVERIMVKGKFDL